MAILSYGNIVGDSSEFRDVVLNQMGILDLLC